MSLIFGEFMNSLKYNIPD